MARKTGTKRGWAGQEMRRGTGREARRDLILKAYAAFKRFTISEAQISTPSKLPLPEPADD